MRDSSRQADTVPALPLLAGVARKQKRVEEDRAVLSRHRQRSADSDRNRACAGRRDAPGLSAALLKRGLAQREAQAAADAPLDAPFAFPAAGVSKTGTQGQREKGAR